MGHPSSPRLLALHALRLKGIAEPAEIVAMGGLDEAELEPEIDELAQAGHVTYRPGRISGYQLTDSGRAEGARLLAAELDDLGIRSAVADAYQRFLGFNQELLAVCTAWQLRPVDGENVVNDHSDADYDAGVHEQLRALHGKASDVLADLGALLDRFDGHRRRLDNAFDRVLAGDNDYFTKPRFPSYHSTWFELHEDLLATLGTERASEGST